MFRNAMHSEPVKAGKEVSVTQFKIPNPHNVNGLRTFTKILSKDTRKCIDYGMKQVPPE